MQFVFVIFFINTITHGLQYLYLLVYIIRIFFNLKFYKKFHTFLFTVFTVNPEQPTTNPPIVTTTSQDGKNNFLTNQMILNKV